MSNNFVAIEPRHTLPGQPHIPTRCTTVPALLSVLGNLGLTFPKELHAAASNGQPLKAVGHKFQVYEVDAALDKANVPSSERLRLKVYMNRNGLL